mmetsp:Transcript_13732/g.24396  ORF Transcript_13732/g.24396 Transcript_13732/m.24396 type:complete len:1129 (+) Transcript_13732:620-4006(+)|eukprot:CAMPEP_0203753712 /NCGR_PEP_ID=MMETSP0098-20131031/7436_1 /ASSEMBLY_ACC=CAM_ASM_000208 /TAXON_ID=96639 /ORGANISM=" , Strain NY0313808BC1" /LENGTH=1128 /DNA_ID=CAMNT_0050644419 /DNA_START=524 /DNA_END=3910 /DNA_ORIENTATION=+
MTDYSEFEFDMDDLSRHEFGGLPAPTIDKPTIILGLCAMPKKAKSKPMKEILQRLHTRNIEAVIFDVETILEKPVEEWPLCHCLIAFFSDGFPLEKAEAYAALRKPFLINELKPQHLLKDRRHVLNLMNKFGVPTPRHLVINRDSSSPSGFDVVVNAEGDMEEYDDYIVINGVRMDKPFVEKPVDGDNHNIYVYYPQSAGGGSCRLFRKIKNRSSEFFPDESSVRREGSFVYESFLRTEGSDVKVYTVDSTYAHSEARKSPAIDGVVSRNENGFEIRYPILLNNVEKEIANRVVQATGQRICGFDVLRSDSMSYVCDVNGWSFVKNNLKYYDDVALILGDLMNRAMGLSTGPQFWQEAMMNSCSVDEEDSDTDVESEVNFVRPQPELHEELRCVIAVVRHGDRTPKQKLKLKVTNGELLALFDKYGDRTSREELKLKSAKQLSDVLRIIGVLIKELESNCESSELDENEEMASLLQARSVLEMHGKFKGINRKVQLKPTKWDKETGVITHAQFIVKWGGVLTHSGRADAEGMGRSFRQKLYPFDGLLRLHSTYRHDLKIYSSNEGRVQVTAAAFAKGMLQLEGHLTPILTSLVRKSKDVDTLLDDASEAKDEIEQIKRRLHAALSQPSPEKERLIEEIASTRTRSVLHALSELNFNPRAFMQELHEHIHGLVGQLRILVKTHHVRYGIASVSTGVANTSMLLDEADEIANANTSLGDGVVQSLLDKNKDLVKESEKNLLMALYRWVKLDSDLYQKKKDSYDLSKIPDIFDSVKYDLIHNEDLLKLSPPHLRAIFDISKNLADVVVSQEYGITETEKRSVGSKICHSLIAKIQSDLTTTVQACKKASEKGKKTPTLKKDMSTSTIVSEAIQDTLSQAENVYPPDDGADTFHRLDKRHARSLGIKSSDRMVRTRLYFTSESHLHSLLNVLRYAAAKSVGVAASEIEMDIPKLTEEAMESINEIGELNYLTHIVFRLFELKPKKQRRPSSPIANPKSPSPTVKTPTTETLDLDGTFKKRFRVTVSLSSGTGVSIVEPSGKVLVGEPQNRQLHKRKLDSAAYGSNARVQLAPCSEMIPLWQNLEYERLDTLFNVVLEDVKHCLDKSSEKDDLSRKFSAKPPSPSSSFRAVKL